MLRVEISAALLSLMRTAWGLAAWCGAAREVVLQSPCQGQASLHACCSGAHDGDLPHCYRMRCQSQLVCFQLHLAKAQGLMA